MTSASLLKGTALMCLVVLIWGTFLPVSKIVLAVVDPYYLTALRYGVAALCFLALLAYVEGGRKVALDGRARPTFIFGTSGFAGFSSPRSWRTTCSCGITPRMQRGFRHR